MWWDSKVEEIRDEARSFAESIVAPIVNRMDVTSEMDSHLLEEMKRAGYMSMLCPKEYGGRGLSTLEYAVVVEELSRICGSTGITIAAANSLGVYPVYLFGSQAQRDLVLPGVGEHGNLISFGLTEPGAGSDASGTKTTAVESNGNWLLNGSKCFITNPRFSTWFIATAVTDPDAGARGISSFLVHKDTDGFSVGKAETKMGLHASDTSMLHFEDVTLDTDAILGPRGDGFKQFMMTLDGGRISIGAMALGLAQGSLDVALRYAKDTLGIEGKIHGRQAIQFPLSDMATQIEAARHLVYHAAYLKDQKQPFAKQSAMAKLYASEVGHFCSDSAIQIMGLDGYRTGSHVERHLRDVRLCEIGEGTSEVHRIVISRYLLKELEALDKATRDAKPETEKVTA
ncbi:MAG: acyl-CoA dehydrogenase [candidate division Zixibacteria bacterium]|nr:acyl-CoA dehydrogenase [candidate division Zixibacteria bacterium]